MGVIKQLDKATVNRIAAGEVVARPVNVIKEMLENSLDAQSTSISIVVKDAGVKQIQISDNGTGIHKDDLKLLCERFATSKLKKFEDLSTVQTYGFRGEALASISMVGHVTVVTKTEDAECAWKLKYQDGKPLQKPAPCAGTQGTQITVEDLFYNMATRRRAFSKTDEYARIFDMVQRYALHNHGVAVSLKKQGQTSADLRTTKSEKQLDTVRTLFGSKTSRELQEVEMEDSLLGVKCRGLISNANFSSTKSTHILFINNRLVENPALQRAILQVYQQYLPRHGRPWTYISLILPPENVDVNVHPSKKEVHFLREDDIIECICTAIDETLQGANKSRTFTAQAGIRGLKQSILEGVSRSSAATVEGIRQVIEDPLVGTGGDGDETDGVESAERSSTSTRVPLKPKYDPRNMVRTDAKELKLDAFNVTTTKKTAPEQRQEQQEKDGQPIHQHHCHDDHDHDHHHLQQQGPADVARVDTEPRKRKASLLDIEQDAVAHELQTIRGLKRQCRTQHSAKLKAVFERLTFVGCVDHYYALAQFETSLLLLNLFKISYEWFRQAVVGHLGALPRINFREPLPLEPLVLAALHDPAAGWQEEDGSREELAQAAVAQLMVQAEMLREMISLDLDTHTQTLRSLPRLIDDYLPSQDRLPMTLLRLATEVEWDNDTLLVDTLSREVAQLYALRPEPSQQIPRLDQVTEEGTDFHTVAPRFTKFVQHIMLPALRAKHYLPPASHLQDGTIVTIASLPDLYRVFERC
eukprot:Clim_evm251s157 gene=Clim_evmTU251s157